MFPTVVLMASSLATLRSGFCSLFSSFISRGERGEAAAQR
jgi:hypothetical protein